MSSIERHAWLETAKGWCERAIVKAGYTVPANTRISIGFAGRAPKKTLGFCFHAAASSDGAREVFIGPHIQDPVEIVGVILHELIHASLPDGEGHGKNFGKAARALGLDGKLTATHPSDDLRAAIETKFLRANPYPAGTIDLGLSGLKKQTTRLLKVQCKECGYTVRTTARWLAEGVPSCPQGDEMDIV